LKSIRLLPVVIVATVALLILKGIGLMTGGGYVLSGTELVQAAGGKAAPAATEPSADDVTIADTSPTLGDDAPTLAMRPTAAAASEGGHDAPASESSSSAEATAAPAEAACPPEASGHGAPPPVECVPSSPAETTEQGDAIPTIQDGMGRISPLTSGEEDSEAALLGRLGERRSELDQREADLEMRAALLEATEKRIEERTRELAALEARVAALVDQREAEEAAGFRSVVSMYENMKARDAAKIFDTLDLPVMLKVARAMNPRKMSPILAAMTPKRAEVLTAALAAPDPLRPAAASGENLANLPQIVGQ
jgi:flagellar motility protein MotE (MotC chaperone)